MSTTEWLPPPRSYNDTPFNRWKTQTQISVFKKLPFRRSPALNVIHLSSTRLVKFGRTVHLAEASALRLVGETTSVRVPKVYCAFRDEKTGISYIVMERIDGEQLGAKRWETRSEEEQEGIVAQLKKMWEGLRGIEPLRPGAVCGADGGTLHDYRIFGGAGPKGMGPFETEVEFNLFLRNGIENTERMKEGKTDMDKLIAMHDEVEAKHLRPVFTHGDISRSNILVKNGRVVALIDFEMSGFYPEYWEYASAMRSNRAKGWKDQIPRFLSPYPVELEMANLWRNLLSHCTVQHDSFTQLIEESSGVNARLRCPTMLEEVDWRLVLLMRIRA